MYGFTLPGDEWMNHCTLPGDEWMNHCTLPGDVVHQQTPTLPFKNLMNQCVCVCVCIWVCVYVCVVKGVFYFVFVEQSTQWLLHAG